MSRSWPSDAGGGAAHAEDEKGLSCLRNERKARLAVALSECGREESGWLWRGVDEANPLRRCSEY